LPEAGLPGRSFGSILNMLVPALLLLTLSAAPADAPRALALGFPAAAAEPTTAPSSAREDRLVYDWRIDGAVTLAAGVGWVVSELYKAELAPEHCRWCQRETGDDAVTDALAWKDTDAASTVGDVGGFVLAPLATFGTLAIASGHEDRIGEMPANALVILEAVTVSSALNQIVKLSVGRERPFVAELPPELKGSTEHPDDNNLSFYSGHSNLVFSLAVSAGTVAHLRGYEGEPYVWGVGIPVAAFVAYSRIAAKKHYLTDVLVGSATGALFGWGIPWLFHRSDPSKQPQVSLAPLPGGGTLTLSF
jgi:membrane-associated phospholipid phosphatase